MGPPVDQASLAKHPPDYNLCVSERVTFHRLSCNDPIIIIYPVMSQRFTMCWLNNLTVMLLNNLLLHWERRQPTQVSPGSFIGSFTFCRLKKCYTATGGTDKWGLRWGSSRRHIVLTGTLKMPSGGISVLWSSYPMTDAGTYLRLFAPWPCWSVQNPNLFNNAE